MAHIYARINNTRGPMSHNAREGAITSAGLHNARAFKIGLVVCDDIIRSVSRPRALAS